MEIHGTLRPGSRVFMIGIGGVSMAPLAELLAAEGLLVTGSDRADSPTVCRLRALGIPVVREDEADLTGCDAVIRTAAAREDHPLVRRTRAWNLPLYERAEVWGWISQRYRHCLCLAGTHGKTTTTGMTAMIALQSGDPTVMLGGELSALGGTHRLSRGDTIILESCEYCNSYHHFHPTVAVVLNLEHDHPDFFPDLDAVLSSFAQFCARVPPDGVIALNADDPGCRALTKRLARPVLWFGVGGEAEVRAENLTVTQGRYSFTLHCGDASPVAIQLRVPGRHNLSNALGAAAACYAAGMSIHDIAAGLESFAGTGRRMEALGYCNGAEVYDDYAHHPSEIAAALAAVQEMAPKRLLLIFQPHTYSRTRALFDDFVSVLSGVEHLYLAEIYPAREENTYHQSSADLQAALPGSVFLPTFEELAEAVRAQARPGDLILTMGAGDVRAAAKLLV